MDREFGIHKKLGITQREMCLLVAKGHFDNVMPHYVVGRNFAVNADPEWLLPAGGIYTFPTAAETWYLSSDDNADDKQFVIQGLTNTYEMFTEVVTLNGFTGVQIRDDCFRFHFMRNYNGDVTAGNVYVGKEAAPTLGVPADVRGYAPVEKQRSYHGAYTVPADCSAFVLSVTGIVRGKTGGQIDIDYMVGLEGKLPMVEYTGAISSSGFFNKDFAIPFYVPEKSDLYMVGVDASVVNGTISVLGSASVVTVHNDTFK